MRNHKFFILFIGYTFALCVHALAIVAGLTMSAPRRPARRVRRRNAYDDDEFPSGSRFEPAKLSTVAVTFAALLFGLFTARGGRATRRPRPIVSCGVGTLATSS